MDFVRSKPCCNCMAPGPSAPHHVSGLGGKGVGLKVSDSYTIPLCVDKCHPEIHQKPWHFDEADIYKVMVRLLTEWIENKTP